jgi:hypothetical protein
MTAPTAFQLESEMIARDAWLLRQFAGDVQTERAGSILFLASLPLVSFHLVETSEWLRRSSTGFGGRLGAYDAELRGIRATLKIFDTDRGGLEEVSRRLRTAQDESIAAFNRHHRGILGPLKRALQDDLGLFFLGADLVCTTHIGAFIPSLAFDADSMATEERDPASSKAHALGVYLGKLLRVITQAAGERFRISWDRSTAFDDEFFWYEDHKAARFYTSLDKQLDAGYGFASPVAFMVGQVNFVHRWLRHVIPVDCELSFRSRFLTCFHTLHGLKALAARAHKRTGVLGTIAAKLQSSRGGRALRQLGTLRNMMAHYDLQRASPDELAANDPFRMVIERLAKRPFHELAGLVDETLEAMSIEFRQLVRVTRKAHVLDAPLRMSRTTP